MTSPKRAREMCTNMTEVFQMTIQAQTRAMARATKESATKESIRETMRADCAKLGLHDLDKDIPPVVHIAGTKGKGSTCALLESILRQGKLRTGIFTSPHLVDVRERIRVNGKLLPQSVFEENIMDTYRLLGPDRMATIGFFQFLTLATFRLFSQRTINREEIDVLILETGIGGRLDFTNAVDKPLCCAITRLDLDHTDILGKSIELIAGEKAGIAKKGVPLFTHENQTPEGLKVISATCDRVGAIFRKVPPLEEPGIRVGIGGGDYQLENAALACALARHVFKTLNPDKTIPKEVFEQGLANCRFPGRAQIETSKDDGLNFYMDGAHTPLSIECASKWFKSVASKNETKILVFHCSADRDASTMMKIIRKVNPDIKIAFFMPPTTGVLSWPKGYHDNLAAIWRQLGDDTEAHVWNDGPIEFRKHLKRLIKEIDVKHVYVTGSFYIIGDALKYWIDGWNIENAFTSDSD